MALPMWPSPMKPMVSARGFCVAAFAGAERDLVSCMFSSRIDAGYWSEDRESNALQPRRDCGKWFTLAAIGSGTLRETACDQSALARGLCSDAGKPASPSVRWLRDQT